LDGKNAGEKQDVFVADSPAFDALKTVLHHQCAPAPQPYFAGFTPGSMLRMEGFPIV
jgi:hypothetical protein